MQTFKVRDKGTNQQASSVKKKTHQVKEERILKLDTEHYLIEDKMRVLLIECQLFQFACEPQIVFMALFWNKLPFFPPLKAIRLEVKELTSELTEGYGHHTKTLQASRDMILPCEAPQRSTAGASPWHLWNDPHPRSSPWRRPRLALAEPPHLPDA